jgi:hypothetical protein
MDILFWKNLSKDVKIEHTAKQYFKQYLYKLEVHAPGCQSIRYDDIGASLSHRQSYTRSYNVGSWLDRKLAVQLQEANVDFLVNLKSVIHDHADIKVRTEEPKISFYAENESTLQAVANDICDGEKFGSCVLKITGPSSDVAKTALQGNAILLKSQPKFKYKVFLKEKRFDLFSRTQIYNYLVGLDALVKIPKHTTEQLNRSGDWLWGCYFYTNDAGVADLVRLINPDIIREVCELINSTIIQGAPDGKST